jgi:hypothetical protein
MEAPAKIVIGALLIAVAWCVGFLIWLEGTNRDAVGADLDTVMASTPDEAGTRPEPLLRPGGATTLRAPISRRNTAGISSPERKPLNHSELVKLFRYLVGLEPEVDASWKELLSFGDGIRTANSGAQSRISLQLVDKVLGTPLYLSGPHGESWELWNRHQFGHYNPGAIRKLHYGFIEFNRDSIAFGAGKVFYSMRLRDNLRAKWWAREILESNPAFRTELVAIYRQQLAESEGFDFYRHVDHKQRLRLNFLARGIGINSYQLYNALCFWGRREIDGSADAAAAGLREIIDSYDQQVFNRRDALLNLEEITDEDLRFVDLPHFVMVGDTVPKIAEMYDSKSSWIAQRNPDIDLDSPRPGMRLWIPVINVINETD